MTFFVRLLMVLFAVTNCYGAGASVGDSIGGGTVFCVSDTEDGIKNCRTDKGASGNYGLIISTSAKNFQKKQ